MFSRVHAAGATLLAMAAFSAGRPKASVAAEAAAGAPAVGDAVQRILDEVGCESQTPAHMPEQFALPAGLDLRTMLEPFDAKLRKPHVKFAGAGGVPLGEQLWPENVDDAIAMIAQHSEPRSMVLMLSLIHI